MFTPALTARAAALIARYASLGMKIATAESCTGGLVAGLLTEIPGSSAVVERGFVTYSNDAKRELLGVPAATLESHGAVSGPTARAMARAPSPTRMRKSRSASPASRGRTAEAPRSRSASCISYARGQARRSWRSSAGSAISAGPQYGRRRSSRRWNCWSGPLCHCDFSEAIQRRACNRLDLGVAVVETAKSSQPPRPARRLDRCARNDDQPLIPPLSHRPCPLAARTQRRICGRPRRTSSPSMRPACGCGTHSR